MNDSRQFSYKPTGQATLPNCDHDNEYFQCATLRLKDVRSFHQSFYSTANKISQDNFLLTCIKTKAVKRHRLKSGTPCERSSKYFIRNCKNVEVPVCLNAFVHVLNISKFRINRITKEHFFGNEIKENRGGFRNRKAFEEKTKTVVEFLEKLEFVEVHYCCDRSARKYLPSELNIARLYRMYIEDIQLDERDAVKDSYFRHIFKTKFNFGFGSPRTDECVACLSYKKKIKAENDEKAKRYLETEYSIHEKRAKAFESLLECPVPADGSPDETVILSFDFQKNLQLPRVPDPTVYYSRNVYLYNFTVVQGYSSSPVTPDNAVSYWWTENEYPKDASSVASCILYHLSHLNLAPYKRVRLVADGCTSATKNSVVVTALLRWLSELAPANIVDVEIVFPVSGHSCTPPTSVFAQIEREVAKNRVVANPDEYVEIIRQFATVRKVGSEVPMLDVERSMHDVMKPYSEWTFSVTRVKRVVLRRSWSTVEMKGELFYAHDVAAFSSGYCKAGKSLSHLAFAKIEDKNVVSGEKKVDLRALLEKHFGADWRASSRLKFFVYLLDVAIVSDCDDKVYEPDEADDEGICCYVEEEADLMVWE